MIAMVKIPQQLYFIHLALMLSPALFAIVIFLGVLPGTEQNSMAKDQIMVFQTVSAVLAIVCVGMSQLVPRFLMRGDHDVPMKKYTNMKIVQWALLEGAAIFIVIVFFLTHEKSMLVPLGILIALLSFARPTVDELIRFKVKSQ